MTTHVFIVNERTFKIHLEYMFVGTGAKDIAVDFNNAKTSGLHHSAENTLCGMIADGSRIRTGDKILFYVEQTATGGGRFFGIFKAVGDGIFLENYTPTQYLYPQLGKNLTFRARIEPDIVYTKGIAEWDVLENIGTPQVANVASQMQWSLIYRKMKAKRGNTMITMYESDRLIQLIRDANGGVALQGGSFTYNGGDIVTNGVTANYTAPQTAINILPRLIRKYRSGQVFESHLQAYITKNVGLAVNYSLDVAVLNGKNIEWIGNEVFCGFGMQKIDICLSVNNAGIKEILPIELKAVGASSDNVRQIKRYIEWLKLYYLSNIPCDITPILIVKKSSMPSTLKAQFRQMNIDNRANCQSYRNLKIIEYELNAANTDLVFNEITY